MPMSRKHPILISGDTYLARLLAIRAHRNMLHGTKRDTLTELRSKYWVTKAKKLVNNIIHHCALCKRLEGKPFKSMEAPPLPEFRVQCSFPFANTGVDYLGPALVRQVYDSEDSKFHKAEIVVYTCAVMRAVHLDLVPDLSASAFIQNLKRFVGRRGRPKLMISDNATCFKNEELKLSEELLTMNIEWKYIVEASPWWGGFWERMVQVVRRALRKVLFRASVTYEELLTVIAEIEGVINSRPLTYVFDDVEDVLTPSHLLLGRRLHSDEVSDGEASEDVDNVKLTKRMQYLRQLADHYWRRFNNEYLTELHERHRQGSNPTRTIELGEIVVIHAKNKRSFWRLGKVISLIPGCDGNARAVTLKVFDGSNNRYIRRPIEKLYPLEVKATGDDDQRGNSFER